MSDKEPQAESEGSIGQSASTGGLCRACDGTIEDTEEYLTRALAVVRQMYDAFGGTSESPGQDEANDAAKALLDEFEA